MVVGLVVGVLVAAALVPGTRSSIAQQRTPVPGDSASAPKLGVSDSAWLKGPRQPVFFRHDIHAGQYRMQCQYCHYSVGVSSEPGIPTMQTCMGCHLVIGGTDSTHRVEIRKLRTAWNEQRPLEWIRVHSLAKHAHFPHMRHVKVMGPNACATCHGEVARIDRKSVV